MLLSAFEVQRWTFSVRRSFLLAAVGRRVVLRPMHGHGKESLTIAPGRRIASRRHYERVGGMVRHAFGLTMHRIFGAEDLRKGMEIAEAWGRLGSECHVGADASSREGLGDRGSRANVERPTSNVERPTSNKERACSSRRSKFSVRCSMFDVRFFWPRRQGSPCLATGPQRCKTLPPRDFSYATLGLCGGRARAPWADAHGRILCGRSGLARALGSRSLPSARPGGPFRPRGSPGGSGPHTLGVTRSGRLLKNPKKK